jgi:hypothetical protein
MASKQLNGRGFVDRKYYERWYKVEIYWRMEQRVHCISLHKSSALLHNEKLSAICSN